MKKVKEYLTKKEYIIFTLALVIIMLSSFSYAFFYSTDDTEEQIVTTECFKVTFVDENDINLDKAYPISNSEGSLLTPYTFTIKNVCQKAGEYQVNVETINDSTLSTSYLKYKLDNNSADILGNQLLVQEYVNKNIIESRNIEAGVILPNEEITYNLRLWIDENSTVEQSANKLYKGKVVIKTIENKEPYKTITLNPNGGEVTHNEVIKVKQRKIGNIEEPTRIGYTFEDWFSDSTLTNRVTENTIVTNELTNLYAKWVAREDTEYRVEHYQMDTSGNYPSAPFETENLEGTTDTNVTPSVRTYEGFTSPSTQTVNVNADGSQVIKYYYERNKYTQTTQGRYMNTSGAYGSYSNLETKDVYYGATYSYSRAATAEYKTASVTSYTVTAAKTNQINIDRQKYTITYNANGGSVSPTSASVYYNASTTLPTPSKSNSIFNGWYTATSGGSKYGNAGALYTVAAAKTMYAQWTKPTYTASNSGETICMKNNYNKQFCFSRNYYQNNGSNVTTVQALLKSQMEKAFGYPASGSGVDGSGAFYVVSFGSDYCGFSKSGSIACVASGVNCHSNWNNVAGTKCE